jgi:cell division transport system permease protein
MKRPAASRSTPVARPVHTPQREKTRVSEKYRHAWLQHHVYVFLSSLGQIIRTPLPTLMTAAVIGIVLALPTGLFLLLENAQRVSQSWDGSVQISLFLKKSVDNQQAIAFADQLYQRKDIEHVRLITPTEALDEYKTLSGFADALNALDENPLPAVLVIQPTQSDIEPQALLNELNQLDMVETAQYDMRWLQRLFAMMDIVQRGVLILSSLLGLSVLLVIGNTIRLAIYNRRAEIEITRLFGATDAFIRRPFLYTGFWYGFMGGIIAWILVDSAFWLLQEPVKRLTALYHSPFELVTLDIMSAIIVILWGIFLGWLGAWVAVNRHLKNTLKAEL